jgi:flagellar hook assembly protein FlgD
MIVGILLREYTGIEDEPGSGSPVVFGFAPNMANPVRDQAAISYVTSTQGRVTLKVYDGAGRLVETLVNSVMPAGAKTVNWDVRNISNGVYFLRLEAENNSATHKMILVK